MLNKKLLSNISLCYTTGQSKTARGRQTMLLSATKTHATQKPCVFEPGVRVYAYSSCAMYTAV